MAFDDLVRMGQSSCLRCGKCLAKCRYMSLDLTQAAKEMTRLRNKERPIRIDKQCVSCFSCETWCEQDAHPYLAILDMRHRQYKEEGLPATTIFMLTNGHNNFRTHAFAKMTKTDQELVTQWKENETQQEYEEMLFPGCNLLTTPGLAVPQLLRGLTIAGGFDHCCGEMFFRLGLIDQAQTMAKRLEAYYADKKIGRMVFFCPAGYHMFSKVMPKLFDVQFDFPKIFIADWWLEQLEQGRLKVEKPLMQEFAIHDSCHARVMGQGKVMQSVRRLIKTLGGRIANEYTQDLDDGICCGIISGAKKKSLRNMLATADRAMGNLRTHKRSAVSYCTGCSLTLTLTGMAIPRAVEPLHLIHLVAKACGAPVPASMKTQARPAAHSILRKGVPLYLDTKRHFLKL